MQPTSRLSPIVLGAVLLLSVCSDRELTAQIKTPLERLADLEEQLSTLDELERRLAELEEQVAGLEDADPPAGFLSESGETFRLGGKFELNFIDVQTERNAPVGTTRNPDPHFEIDVLRLEPRIDLNREVSLRAQIDFKPREGDVRLKEATVRHEVDPRWWLRSEVQLGLDDRFIRMSRDTENYPLIGNAFWRDESLAFFWAFRIGDKDGPPLPEDEAASSRAATGAFDFRENPGAVTLHFSVGNGYRLDTNEVGLDRAEYNDLVQDDRNDDDDLSLRELGFGVGYGRDFGKVGEIDVLGFYYNDQLSAESISFLQNDLTLRDSVGNVIGGYGDSNKDSAYRYGVGVDYFLSMERFSEDFRAGDGLRLAGQWISAKDGDLRRDGWFVQASYRYSFEDRLLFDRYLHGVTPVVRFGELDTDLTPEPTLPGTWDREEILVGLLVEVTRDITLKLEYTFFDEDPGAGSPKNVDNNEFLAQLRIDF